MSEDLDQRTESGGAGSDRRGETRLLAAAKAGDHHAYTLLCERHRGRVWAKIRRMIQRHEDCEDAMQEAMMQAFRHLGSFRGQSAFSTWLCRIAINSALMAIRKDRPSRNIAIEDLNILHGRSFEPACNQVTAEMRCIKDAQHRLLRKAIKGLRPSLRSVVEMHVLEEKSLVEIATLLGVSLPAVKSRMMRARKCLAERLTASELAGRSDATRMAFRRIARAEQSF
jgi:RNA polymerase sigma-70 factor (ECF subfamily)